MRVGRPLAAATWHRGWPANLAEVMESMAHGWPMEVEGSQVPSPKSQNKQVPTNSSMMRAGGETQSKHVKPGFLVISSWVFSSPS